MDVHKSIESHLVIHPMSIIEKLRRLAILLLEHGSLLLVVSEVLVHFHHQSIDSPCISSILGQVDIVGFTIMVGLNSKYQLTKLKFKLM